MQDHARLVLEHYYRCFQENFQRPLVMVFERNIGTSRDDIGAFSDQDCVSLIDLRIALLIELN